ncbi:Phosphatidylglycerophosphatase B [Candidatus Erwinia haradaeae]|uniref:undecaprenyl-diphosphate phosphatase n=2 Tax=Candidatus Erwinia haradaeae TaxID=1922217 RepID=A0A451DD58_9GAMM|nr:Phosphatidylglycerophosphatase B [Candidatus Erwinia haradaeae]
MVKTLKCTTFSALILLLIPLITIIDGWQWKPFNMGYGSQILFFVAETLTYPFIVWTNIILFVLLIWRLRYRGKSLVLLWVLVMIALVVGQSVKILLKDRVHSARPFYIWCQEYYSVNVSTYHHKEFLDMKETLNKCVVSNKQFPPWLMQHWLNATHFSFPSGHTIFSATWALLVAGFLWPHRCYFTVMIVMIWAIAVISSRLVLGMHWSRDLFASIMLSWVLAICTCFIMRYIRVVCFKELQTIERKKII